MGLKRAISPAMAVSVIALIAALAGTGYAANSVGSKGPHVIIKKGPRGQRGPKGPTGPAGPSGHIGPTGPEGAAPGAVYGTLIPEFGEGLPAHLDPARSQHLALAKPLEGSGPGTWCFVTEGREAAKTSVIAAPAELPVSSVEETEVPVVEWLPAAADCEAGQIEIRSWFFKKPEEGTGLRTYSSLVPFSFVVEGGS